MPQASRRATPQTFLEGLERYWRQILRYSMGACVVLIAAAVAYNIAWSSATHTPAIDIIGQNSLTLVLACVSLFIEQITRQVTVSTELRGGGPAGENPFGRTPSVQPAPPHVPLDGSQVNPHGGPGAP